MKGIGLVLVLVGFLAMGIFIGRGTKKTVVNEIVLPDVSRQTDKIDSLNRLLKADSAMIKRLYFSLDSVRTLMPINHKKLNNDIKVYKGFSRPKRTKFIDSIYSANVK